MPSSLRMTGSGREGIALTTASAIPTSCSCPSTRYGATAAPIASRTVSPIMRLVGCGVVHHQHLHVTIDPRRLQYGQHDQLRVHPVGRRIEAAVFDAERVE